MKCITDDSKIRQKKIKKSEIKKHKNFFSLFCYIIRKYTYIEKKPYTVILAIFDFISFFFFFLRPFVTNEPTNFITRGIPL